MPRAFLRPIILRAYVSGVKQRDKREWEDEKKRDRLGGRFEEVGGKKKIDFSTELTNPELDAMMIDDGTRQNRL